jgi:hypothetical protein
METPEKAGDTAAKAHRFQVPGGVTPPPTLSTTIVRRPRTWVGVVGALVLAVGLLGAAANVRNWVWGTAASHADELDAMIGYAIATVIQVVLLILGALMIRSYVLDRRRCGRTS